MVGVCVPQYAPYYVLQGQQTAVVVFRTQEYEALGGVWLLHDMSQGPIGMC